MHIAFLNPQGNFDAKDSFLTEHPDFGGQLVYVKEICLALAEIGVQVDIITRKIDDPDWPGFAEETGYYDGFKNNPRIVRIECGGQSFLNKELLWPHLDEFVDNIISFYGDNLPDFFTGHYADGGYCASLLKSRTGIGFTFTGHSLGAQKLDKLGMSLDNAESMEAKYHFSDRIAAERMTMAHAARIITSTNQERMQQYGHDLYQGVVDVNNDEHFAVIPPGVNLRVFSDQPTAEDDQIAAAIEQRIGQQILPYLVASSRLDEKKNLLGLVEAYAGSDDLQQRSRLALFIRGVDDPYADISMLSATEQEVIKPLLQTIQSAGIESLVDFLDVRSQLELAASYRYFAKRNSVFVLTAFYEPFGLAPIEAGACGLAVVATKNGGPTEIFADGSGMLVDPFDSDDIARGLSQCLDNSEEYRERVLQRVLSTYTWDKTAKHYLAIFEKCLAAEKAREPFVLPALNGRERLNNYLSKLA